MLSINYNIFLLLCTLIYCCPFGFTLITFQKNKGCFYPKSCLAQTVLCGGGYAVLYIKLNFQKHV